MSNSQLFNVLAGSYFDQLCEGQVDYYLSSHSPDMLSGSANNPLMAMRLLCVDVETEVSFDSKELAEVTGVPSSWFDDERLVAPPDEVIRALGVMALIYLSSRRNEALKRGFKVDVAENAMEAEMTFREVLAINSKLAQ